MSVSAAQRALTVLALALAGLSGWYFWATYDSSDAWSASPLILVGFCALFLVCEATRLRFEIRRHTYQVTISEVALVLGLFWLSPVEMLATRLIATLAVWGYKRMPLRKIQVNVAMVAAEVAVATYVFGLFDVTDARDVSSWVAAYVAVGFADLTCISVVIAAITLVQGRLSSAELARL